MSLFSSYDEQGRPPLAYYLIFPLDAWKPAPDAEYIAQKRQQAWPVLLAVLPLVVLMTGFGLRLGLFTSLFFYAIQALLLATVAMFHLKLHDFGQILELFVNIWLALVLITVGLLIPAFLVSQFFF